MEIFVQTTVYQASGDRKYKIDINHEWPNTLWIEENICTIQRKYVTTLNEIVEG